MSSRRQQATEHEYGCVNSDVNQQRLCHKCVKKILRTVCERVTTLQDMYSNLVFDNIRQLDGDELEHLQNSEDPSTLGNFAFEWACGVGETEIVRQLLLDERVDPTIDDNEAFIAACSRGHVSVVKMLLQDTRVDPTTQANNAIISAVNFDHTDIVKMLLDDSRPDPSVSDNLSIRLASTDGNDKLVELLLSDNRVDPSAVENDAIVQASQYGHTDIARILLSDARVDTSAQNSEPIRRAYRYGYTELVVLLIDHRITTDGYKLVYEVQDDNELTSVFMIKLHESPLNGIMCIHRLLNDNLVRGVIGYV